MNVLVTGASGFIASQIVTDLIKANHSVTCCVRNVAYTKSLFPDAAIIPCDFINDKNSNIWIRRLNDIDVVINCVGILHHPQKQTIWDIHYHTPRALFDACRTVGIKTVIQISALGIDKSNVEYAKSKKAVDDYLISLPIPSVVVRPSLVYGRGSYGGTSLFRGMAGLPWITPMPGNGAQEFQPIHLEDLSKAVMQLIENPPARNCILDAVGPKRTTLRDVLTTMRSWLGFGKAKLVSIPLWFIRTISLVGDFIPYSATNTNSYKMLVQNNVTTDEETKKFQEYIGFVPRDFFAGIYSEPSTVQDHWHARLYFLKPLLRLSIAFVWIFTAVCCLFLHTKVVSYNYLTTAGIGSFFQPILMYGASLIDAALGIAMLCNYQLKKVCFLQIGIILIYSAIIAWRLPDVLLDPFAPVIKNIPLIVATLVLLALESDR